MNRVYSQVTDDVAIENAICDFVEAVNGLKTFIAGTDHKREWPYQTVYIRNDIGIGKAWENRTISGTATTQFKKQTQLMCDIDIFTKRYNDRHQAIRKDPRYYGKLITNAIDITELQTPLKTVGLKLQSVKQAVSSMNIDDGDKWLKQGVIELELAYINTSQIVDTDTIKEIETPIINITE